MRYKKVGSGYKATSKHDDSYAQKITDLLAGKYQYHLSVTEFNAIKYAHGEGRDHHPTDRIILPRGAFIHCCDMISARIWFDQGKSHDSWNGQPSH